MLKNDVRRQVYIRNIYSQRYEELICFHSYTANTNKYFAAFAGFEFATLGFFTAALPIELLSEQGLKASVIQFKFKNHFCTN